MRFAVSHTSLRLHAVANVYVCMRDGLSVLRHTQKTMCSIKWITHISNCQRKNTDWMCAFNAIEPIRMSLNIVITYYHLAQKYHFCFLLSSCFDRTSGWRFCLHFFANFIHRIVRNSMFWPFFLWKQLFWSSFVLSHKTVYRFNLFKISFRYCYSASKVWFEKKLIRLYLSNSELFNFLNRFNIRLFVPPKIESHIETGPDPDSMEIIAIGDWK